MINCIEEEDKKNAILDLGGPDSGYTMAQQGELIFKVIPTHPPTILTYPIYIPYQHTFFIVLLNTSCHATHPSLINTYLSPSSTLSLSKGPRPSSGPHSSVSLTLSSAVSNNPSYQHSPTRTFSLSTHFFTPHQPFLLPLIFIKGSRKRAQVLGRPYRSL